MHSFQSEESLLSPSCAAPPFEVQVPSLGGINILSVQNDLNKPAARGGRAPSPRQPKPNLRPIDTEAAAAAHIALIHEPHTARSSAYSGGAFYSSPAELRLSPARSAGSSDGDRVRLAEYARARRAGRPYLSPPYYAHRKQQSGSSIGSLSPCGFNPATPLTPPPATPPADGASGLPDDDEGINPEDAWNLVPYHIPWGSSYVGYRGGTLPGPDGACLFLRSPTPLKNQRTGQACEKCRERKAKCSGTRPSCARCVARGHVCEYGPELKQARGTRHTPAPSAGLSRTQHRGHSRADSATTSASSGLSSPADSPRDDASAHGGARSSPLPHMPPEPGRRHSAFEGPRSACAATTDFAHRRPRRMHDRARNMSAAELGGAPQGLGLDFGEPAGGAGAAPPLPHAHFGRVEPLPLYQALQDFRFPPRETHVRTLFEDQSDTSAELEMDVDYELAPPAHAPLFADLGTPTHAQQLHVHAPSALRYSASMPHLAHADAQGLFLRVPASVDEYSAGTSSAEDTDFEFDFAAPHARAPHAVGVVALHPRLDARSGLFPLDELPSTMLSDAGADMFSADGISSCVPDGGPGFALYAGSYADTAEGYVGVPGGAAHDALAAYHFPRHSHAPPFDAYAEWSASEVFALPGGDDGQFLGGELHSHQHHYENDPFAQNVKCEER